MPDTNFDWTFDDIPAEESAEAVSAERPAAPRRRPTLPRPPAQRPIRPPAPRAASSPRRRRLAALLLAPVVVAGLALYLVYAIGWQRVRGQLAREIAYEDEQSWAGNVNAVMALHAWGNEPWQRRRTAEVAAGLTAPLPAANLAPVPEPPQLLTVDTFGERLYTSTVVRQYTDSSGDVYAFRFTQRYFNNGPGLWQRLPPDEARLTATALWAGRRISVTHPVADTDWMAAALPQIDAYLIEACADWACPADLALPVVFSGDLDDLPHPMVVDRTIEAAGGYPIIFDTPFHAPRYPRLLVLPSPQLAGAPHDEAASQALVRAITADLLGQLAAEAAGTNRAQRFYFLDALVARAEARLGLSSVPAPQPALTEYLPVAELWRDTVGNSGGASPPKVVPRLQALWFLNEALGDRQPTSDAGLLATVREAHDLAGWLTVGAQLDGPSAIEQWDTVVGGQLAAAPVDWRPLTGLAYACGGTGWLVGAEGPRPLPQAVGQAWLGPLSMSPDGVHLVAPAVVSETRQLHLVSLDNMTATVLVPHDAYPVGWASTGALVYVDQTPSNGRMVNRLRVMNVATGAFMPVTGMEVVTRQYGAAWSANRQALALTLTDGVAAADARTVPAMVAFDEPFNLVVAAWQGHSPALSPDGRWLAYITTQTAGLRAAAAAEARVDILDLETRRAYTAAALTNLPTDRPLEQLTALAWSPDGNQLAVVASRGNTDQLFRVSLNGDGADGVEAVHHVPVSAADFQLVGFSADSQYLALVNNSVPGPRLVVLNLAEPGARAFEANAVGVVWSPTGHRLAIANAAGLFVADPDSGETQWVAAGHCVPSWTSFT